MQIKKLKLTNAFQHGKLEMDFQPFTSIVGPNGCGKSNLLEAIGMALTGVLTLPGKLESAIKEGEEKGKVEMSILSEGEIYQLTSHLGKANRSLKCDARDLKITKSSEVLEYLERQILRTPFNIVNTSSIIRQGALEAGLFATQAKRTDAFMRMAGLSDIEKKRQQLADEKASVTVPMLSFSIDDAEAKIKELQDYLSTMWEEKNTILPSDEKKLELCQQLVALTERVTKARQELVLLEKEVREAAELSSDAQKQLAIADDEVKGLEELDAELSPQVEEAKLRLANNARAKKDWDRKVALQLKIQELQGELEKLVSPGDYAGADQNELASLVTETAVKMKAERETIAVFEGTADQIAECPTCRKPCTVQEAEQIVNVAKTTLNDLEALQKEATEAYDAAVTERKAWEKAEREYRTEKTRLEFTIANKESSFQELGDVEEPKDDAEDQELVAAYVEVTSSLKDARTKATTARELATEAATNFTTLNTRMQGLQEQAGATFEGGSVSLGEARVYVSEHNANVEKLNQLEGKIHSTEKQLRDEQERLEKLKDDHAKARTLAQYTDYLEFARSALHRDNFPSGKVKDFIDRMLVSANAYLDCMQAGFSVSYHKEAGFVAYFPADNKYIRGDRLSGGERITFALAFRFAVNDIHTDTGFLVLDEPTVWLDDKHIDYVINALSLVKSKLVPRVQIIIVTHDEKVAAVADCVYEVGR